MKMGYAVIVRLGNQWCHRDNIFGIVVLNGTKVTKLTLIGVVVSYNIRSLYIDSISFWLCADKINFASLKLSDHHFIAQAYKVIVDDIFYHLFNISLARTTNKSITNTIVFKIEFVVALKDFPSVDIIPIHFMNHVRFAQILSIIDNGSGGDVLTLRPHILCYAVGRNDFPCIVSKEMNKVLQKRHIADIIPLDNILQQYGAIDIHLVLPCILFVKSYLFQTRQSTKLNKLC